MQQEMEYMCKIYLLNFLIWIILFCEQSSEWHFNGRAHFTNVSICLDTNIWSYLETSGGQSSNLYLNAVYFFNASVN